jgi:hypothetical protein
VNLSIFDLGFGDQKDFNGRIWIKEIGSRTRRRPKQKELWRGKEAEGGIIRVGAPERGKRGDWGAPEMGREGDGATSNLRKDNF